MHQAASRHLSHRDLLAGMRNFPTSKSSRPANLLQCLKKSVQDLQSYAQSQHSSRRDLIFESPSNYY